MKKMCRSRVAKASIVIINTYLHRIPPSNEHPDGDRIMRLLIEVNSSKNDPYNREKLISRPETKNSEDSF